MIYSIQRKITSGKYEFSQHTLDETIKHRILVREIQEVILQGDIIEDYPKDKYGPSCLIFGVTLQNRPLHILCSYPSREPIKIISVYEPDPQKWIQYRVRR